jgi:predicted transcriptional regulator
MEIGFMIMRRSKLEMHIDVLKALAYHGRLKPTHIMYKAKINSSVLKKCLDLLIQQNLVKERVVPMGRKNKTSVLYTITERGLSALKDIKEINIVLQVFGEENIPSAIMLSESSNKLDFHSTE